MAKKVHWSDGRPYYGMCSRYAEDSVLCDWDYPELLEVARKYVTCKDCRIRMARQILRLSKVEKEGVG